MKKLTRTRVALGTAILVYLLVVGWIFLRPERSFDPRVTVRIAHWQVEIGPSSGIAAVIRRYEALNPGVRIEQMIVPPPVYKQFLRTNLAGDNAPDIIEFGVWLDGLTDIPVRYFEPLTSYLNQVNPYNRGTPIANLAWYRTFADELYEQRLNSPEPGQYYAVTLTRGSMRLFCNRELLREITGSDHVPQTMMELRQLGAKVAAYAPAKERRIMLLAGSGFNAQFLLNGYFAAATSKLREELDREGFLALSAQQVLGSYLSGQWNFQRPDVVAALHLLAELHRQMRPGYMQLGRDEAAREFLHGDALFIFSGTWDATSLRKEAPFPLSALRCPQLTQDDPVVGKYVLGRFADGNDITMFGFYLNKRAKQRDEAIKFLQFLTSFQGNRLFSEVSGWPPSIKQVPMTAEVAELLSPADGYSNGAVFLTAGGSSRALLLRNLHLLSGPTGSVEKLAAALDRELPVAARADLHAIARDSWLTALPQDARIAALGLGISALAETDALRLRQERIEAAQNLSEARAMLIDQQLQRAP